MRNFFSPLPYLLSFVAINIRKIDFQSINQLATNKVIIISVTEIINNSHLDRLQVRGSSISQSTSPSFVRWIPDINPVFFFDMIRCLFSRPKTETSSRESSAIAPLDSGVAVLDASSSSKADTLNIWCKNWDVTFFLSQNVLLQKSSCFQLLLLRH